MIRRRTVLTLMVLTVVAVTATSCTQVSSGGAVSSASSSTLAPAASIAASASVSETGGGDSGVLLIAFGMHVEPFGAQVSAVVTGREQAEIRIGTGGARGLNYNALPDFQRSVNDIIAVADILEKHGGVMTVQAQTPFSRVAAETGSDIFPRLEAAGHEIALHFHENAHLGENCEQLPAETWAAVMSEEIQWLEKAGARGPIRYWSGGNLYGDLLEAAELAGLDVMGDYKSRVTQESDELVLGVNPWRPAAGPDPSNMSGFATHDPDGAVIYLPDGAYDARGFASKGEMKKQPGGDQVYFDFLKQSLLTSLAESSPDRINVFRITVHPGEFIGDRSQPYAVIDDFLTEVVDPLVQQGRVRWAIYSEMADAYAEWEAAHPGVSPRIDAGGSSKTGSVGSGPSSSSPTTVPKNSDGKVRVERDVTYGVADGVDLKMDIYYPLAADSATHAGTGRSAADSARVSPALVYIHGGGWVQGDKAAPHGRALEELARHGYLVAAINYRLAPAYTLPDIIEDCMCAVRYLRAHAEELGIDPDRIGAFGGSAGGHLAAMLGTADSSSGFDQTSGGWPGYSSRVQAVCDQFGPADLTVVFDDGGDAHRMQVLGTVDKLAEVARQCSPVTWASADDPPFLILHGEEDTLVPIEQSELLLETLRSVGVDAELIRVAHAGHGFSPQGGIPDPSPQELAALMVEFFDRHLKN